MILIQPQPNNRRFSYQASWRMLIVGVVFFTCCGLYAASISANDRRGLTIDGFITLSPEHASVFWATIAALSLGMTLMAIISIVIKVLAPQELTLASEGLFAPRWIWSREPILIPYNDIRALTPFQMRGHSFLKITHAHGRLTITASKLPSSKDFSEFGQLLNARMRELRPHGALRP